MDKKTLVKIMDDTIYAYHGISESHRVAVEEFQEAADKILAALEAEKAKEIVLVEGDIVAVDIQSKLGAHGRPMNGKRGQVRFRPTKGDK